jgi:hypothetical protein
MYCAMRLIGVLMLLAGCDVGSPATPDTPGGPGDGSQHGLGMFVDWHASPALPGMLTDKITVSDATFQLDHFQVVADAGSVTRSKYLLAWAPGTTPEQDVFPDAPPGVYSKITLVMMGGTLGDDAYQIRGTWRDNGITTPFEVHDRNQLGISIDCNATLSGGGAAAIAIKVNLADAISRIDFRSLEEDNGVLELSDGQALSDFRGRLKDAFQLDN